MSSRSESTSRISAYRVSGVAILLVAALVALVLALLVGGGAKPPLLQDPGPFVLWGTPVAKLVMNVSGAVMLGSLVLALFGLRAGSGRSMRL